MKFLILTKKPGWHNWLARETFNLKVVGSTPTSGDWFSFCFFILSPVECLLREKRAAPLFLGCRLIFGQSGRLGERRFWSENTNVKLGHNLILPLVNTRL
jgi:hypothetical protein